MNKKRITAIILSAFLLIGASSAVASKAGGAEDPLISLSYARGEFTNSAVSLSRTSADTALLALYDKYASVIESGGLSTGRFFTDEFPKGEVLNLRAGASVILLGGDAELDILFGKVINVTTGSFASRKQMEQGSRYLVAEHSLATVTVLSNSSFALDGDAKAGELAPAFSDVPFAHWAFSAIEGMAERGLINGKGGGIFDPSANMTRADFVTILGRMSAADESKYQVSMFSDIAPGQYYSPYVNWAAEKGIVTGYGNGKFGPSDKINRAQMASIIIRFAEFAGVQIPDAPDTPFSDNASIPSWAKSDVYASRNMGLITGREGNLFAPLANSTRAEVCSVIYRLIDAYGISAGF